MNCERCGAPIAAGSTVCSQCNTETVPAVVPAPAVEVARPQLAGAAAGSVILGLLSLFCLFFTAIPAIVLGHRARHEIRQSQGKLTGQYIALVGLTLGYLGIVWGFWVLSLLGQRGD